MTKKENLYFEYLRLNNELMMLRGEETTLVTEETARTYQFKNNANGYTVKHLEEMINSVQQSIAKAKQKKAAEDWYKTPDGIRYKALHTKRSNELIEERKSLILSTKAKVSKMIKVALGDKWGVQRLALGDGCMSVGVIEKVHDDGFEECHFRCIFEIMFETFDVSLENTEEFKISFASKRTFDPFADGVSREYVIGLGKFAENTYLLTELKEILLDASRKEFNLNEKIDKERSMLNTPEQFKLK